MTISSFCFLDTQTLIKHNCDGERKRCVTWQNFITFAIFAIEFNPGHISKKTINQYRKLNSSHLKTAETTLILLILKAYRI